MSSTLTKIFSILFLFFSSSVCFSVAAVSKPIELNEAILLNPPSWLSKHRVEKVITRIQNKMEWGIHKISVSFTQDQAQFEKIHKMGPFVIAVSLKQKNEIHLGPKINTTNFETEFAHELVHIILHQKYRSAIPSWLEEGLANYLANKKNVNYQWLASQAFMDVKKLSHPFSIPLSENKDRWKYHYQASTATIEMIAARCNLSDLLQLSVKQNIETYLSTFCEINDISEDLKKWILKKSKELN